MDNIQRYAAAYKPKTKQKPKNCGTADMYTEKLEGYDGAPWLQSTASSFAHESTKNRHQSHSVFCTSTHAHKHPQAEMFDVLAMTSNRENSNWGNAFVHFQFSAWILWLGQTDECSNENERIGTCAAGAHAHIHVSCACTLTCQIQWEWCLYVCICMGLRVCKLVLAALFNEQHSLSDACDLSVRLPNESTELRVTSISSGIFGIFGDQCVTHTHTTQHTCSNSTALVLITILIHHHPSTRRFKITFYFYLSEQLRTLCSVWHSKLREYKNAATKNRTNGTYTQQ